MSLGSFAQGLGQGVQTGKQLRDLWDARGLSKDLGAIDDARNPITPEPGEDGSVGESYYEVGGKRYFTKEAPPDYLWEADRLQRQADAYRKRGRVDDAVNLQAAARERLKTGQAEHFSALSNRVKPLFFDDTGRRRSMDEVMADPAQRDALLSVMNDPAFESVRNVGGNAIRVGGMTPLGDGRAALDLDVIDPSTGRVVRRGPATEGRSSDPNDVVAGMTAERLFSGIQDHLRGNSPDYAKLDDANRAIAGRESLMRGVVGGPGLGAAGSAPSGAGGGIIDSLSRTESSPTGWGAKNDVQGSGGKGHFGRLQFSQGRLREASSALGIEITPTAFMKDPELQQQVERWHFNDIDQFIADQGLSAAIGSTIHGTPLTIDSMRAVAHLGGKAGLKKYVESGGRYNPADANGTSLSDYARTHAGASGSSQAPSAQPQPSAPRTSGGLDAAIAYGARYPSEMGLADIERVGATGSVTEPKILTDGLGGATAVNPNSGQEYWSREGTPKPVAPPRPHIVKGKDGSVTARDPQTGEELWSAAGEGRSEEEQLKLAKARREDVQHEGELILGDRWTPQHYAKTVTTLDAMGIPYGKDKIGPILARAIAITEAYEEKDRFDWKNPLRWGNKDTKFDSYTLGIAAAGMGMRASDESEIAKKLVEPMQAITGGKGMSAEDQALAFGTLAVAQKRFRYSVDHATKIAETNVRYGVTDKEFGDFIQEHGKLAPEDYAAMLKEQADRDNAN